MAAESTPRLAAADHAASGPAPGQDAEPTGERTAGGTRSWWPASWWRRRGLRARLTVTATAALAVALAAGAWLGVHALAGSLVSALDGTARQGADQVAALIDANRLPDPVPVAGGTVIVQVLDADGRIRAGSPGADLLVPLLSGRQLSSAVRTGDAVTLEGGPYAVPGPMRVVAVRAGGGQTVIAGVSFAQVRASITTLAHSALIGTPVLIIVLAGVNWLVIGGALRPITGLRKGAQDITSAVGRRRLPVPETRDEVHRLAVTLNDMLAHLQASEARQRELVSDTAHELRSPIASIRAQLEVALDHPHGVDWRETASDVLADTLRLSRLAEDLLVLARLDERGSGTAAAVQAVDLEAVAHGTIARYASARVPVTVNPAPVNPAPVNPAPVNRVAANPLSVDPLPMNPFSMNRPQNDGCLPVLGDQAGLDRVVSNLVDNGVRYARTRVTVGIGRDGGNAVLTVTDDGPGVPAADRQRVFDRFTRLDDGRSRGDGDSGGAGLGLAIVRGIVHAHGGEVWLEDAGPGVRAVVRLPASPGD